MNYIKNIFSSSRIAFQCGLVSRSLGLLLFTIGIAHTWPTTEIARFESFSIFQYILFFTWFPAWCIVLLRKRNKGNAVMQKSFLFSNLFGGLVLVIVLFLIMILFHSYLLPWTGLKALDTFNVFCLMISYFLMQALVYIFYLDESVKKQWVLTVIQIFTWIALAGYTTSMHGFLIGSNVLSVITLVFLYYKIDLSGYYFFKEFWKELVQYAVYLSFGAATVILAAYYVQSQYGLGEELNWYRYGTRELPMLPALLAGFGQSFLAGHEVESNVFAQTMKKGLAVYIKLLALPLAMLIIWSVPVFRFIYGDRFIAAASLMSVYLLIYIPRLIPSSALLQFYDDRKSLLWIGVIEFLFILFALLLFGHRFGLTGIAWILIAGTGIEKMVQLIVLKRRHHMILRDYIPLPWYLAWSALLLTAYILQSMMPWE